MAQIKPLPEEIQQVAIEDLGEVPERIPLDLAAFKLWIQQQPHLKARMDDQFLIQFLRGCKYNLEKAQEKIERYYTMKTKYPNMFSVTDVNDAQFQERQKTGNILFLPTPINDTGRRIVLMRWAYDATKYNLEEVFSPSCAMYELTLIDDPYACINGTTYIVDLANATMTQYFQMSPVYVKKVSTFLEKSLPLRIRAVYIINLSAISQQMINLVLPLLSEKLKEKLVFCAVEDLPQYIPKQYIPQDYGGTNMPTDCVVKENAKRLHENWKYFEENAQYGTDESKRIGDPLDFEGSYGVGGSFRTIAVD